MKREMTAFGLVALLVVVYSVGGEMLNPTPLEASDSYEDGVEALEAESSESKEDKEVAKATELKEETAVPEELDENVVKETTPVDSKESDAEKEKALAEAKAKELEERKEKEAEMKKERELEAKRAKEAEAKKEAERLAKQKADAKAKAEAEKVDYTVEPETIMKDWQSLSKEKKVKLIEHSIAFHVHTNKTEQSPVTLNGTVDEFIQVIDDRYEEIQEMSGEEEYRMSNSTVAAQVSVQGHWTKLFEFDY